MFDSSSSPEKMDGKPTTRRKMSAEKKSGKDIGVEVKAVRIESDQETEAVRETLDKRQEYENDGLEDIENQMESLKIDKKKIEETSKGERKDRKARKVLRTKDTNGAATSASEKTRRIRPISRFKPADPASQTDSPPTTQTKHQTKLTVRSNSSCVPCPVHKEALLDIRAEKDDYTHIWPLLDLCSDHSARKAPTSFSSWSSKLEPHFDVSKIAEASYGEVYRLSLKTSIPGLTKSDESVLKIMALKPSPERCPTIAPDGTMSKADTARHDKIAWMSSPASVLSEVQLLQLMTPIPGFTNFRELRVLQGRPAPAFVRAWKQYNKSKRKGEKSVFPDPSRKANYDEEQLWAVIEMQDAGCDLDNIVLRDIWSIWDVFWGVALAIGKGEKGVRFEHRDLHLGNICIRSARPPSKDDQDTHPSSALTAPRIQDTSRKLGFTGLETTIIDYTLSRADIGSLSKENSVAYLDLEADPAVFSADSTHEYQYEIYRQMRSAVYYGCPLAFTSWDPSELPEHLLEKRSWKEFHPLTNLVWLHFLLHKLLENVVWPSSDPELEFTLARVDGKAKRAARRARKMEAALVALSEMLDPERLGDDGDERRVQSVGELVAVALVEGWLREEDVVGVAGEGDEE
jgi:serine/threonine-protein kinase haspin